MQQNTILNKYNVNIILFTSEGGFVNAIEIINFGICSVLRFYRYSILDLVNKQIIAELLQCPRSTRFPCQY